MTFARVTRVTADEVKTSHSLEQIELKALSRSAFGFGTACRNTFHVETERFCIPVSKAAWWGFLQMRERSLRQRDDTALRERLMQVSQSLAAQLLDLLPVRVAGRIIDHELQVGAAINGKGREFQANFAHLWLEDRFCAFAGPQDIVFLP